MRKVDFIFGLFTRVKSVKKWANKLFEWKFSMQNIIIFSQMKEKTTDLTRVFPHCIEKHFAGWPYRLNWKRGFPCGLWKCFWPTIFVTQGRVNHTLILYNCFLTPQHTQWLKSCNNQWKKEEEFSLSLCFWTRNTSQNITGLLLGNNLGRNL